MQCVVQIYCEIFAAVFMSATVNLHLQKSEEQRQMQNRKEPQHVSVLSVDSTTVKFILFFYFNLCVVY
jgi:hypothetical protein